ncbi:MAG: flagellar basal-body MS-ring/collar protein FliF [Rhodocyclaceae bacterium]|nr:flagellar basal-body MS-ring/collar protein FliF [Rhodocyclaceae bacterium]
MAATTDTIAENSASENPLERLRDAFNRLGAQQKIAFMVGVAAIIAVLVGTLLWSQQPDWKVLFSNLGEKDGGAIITQLEQQNIPHRMSDNGSIMVPANRVHEVRLKLASQGLPRGGMVGFELMENQKFGISQFAEQVNYQRGLEGELARTIMSIGAIASARVHLAIPKPSVFIREEQKPTASVMLNLYGGRTLDAGQIAGITHLVSASVPQLASSSVTIIDQTGSMLSKLKSKLNDAGLDPAQMKYVRDLEESVVRRISDILQPMLGEDNFKVQIAADVDFSQSEQTAETFRPNNTPETSSVRSLQNNETASVNQTSGGVPGALTNQPPVPATAPLTTPPTGAAGQPARPGNPQGRVNAAGIDAPLNPLGQPISTTKTATTNFEIDKTIRYTKQAIGSIRRLSAAVVVNHRKEIDKNGKPVSKALPDTEIKQINDLVREAMGFSKERGDSLSVANSPFTVTEKLEVETPLWKDPEIVAYGKDLFKYLLIAGIVAFIYLKIIQPSLKTMFPPPVKDEPETAEEIADSLGHVRVAGEEGEEEDVVRIDHYAVKVQKARDIAQADSQAVANIIKDWMNANAA